MTLDLAQAAALHRRAIDAGMRGVLPEGIEVVESAGEYGLRSRLPNERKYPKPQCVFGPITLAACREWLREWCWEYATQFELRNAEDASGMISLACRLVSQQEARNANQA